MSSLLLVLLPLIVGLLLSVRSLRIPPAPTMVFVGMVCTVLAFSEEFSPSAEFLAAEYVRLDATARLFLPVINSIFLGIAGYIWNRVDSEPVLHEGLNRFAVFTMIFLAASNAVLIGNHLLLVWLALEVSTLAAAPLIIRQNAPASQLASLRYLLFSSVGLGLVLLGILCIVRAQHESGITPEFMLDRLKDVASATSNSWGHLGVALMVFGLGTKLGLAPMYTWLPETYDEAPPAVTALLGAVQFNAALVLLLRVIELFRPTHLELITYELEAMGIISMLVSTASIIATRNLKRLIAYASINHAGVIAIGLGIGKTATYGVLLYAISNAFIKTILFLTAGKIRAHYRTKDTQKIAGLLKDLPYSGIFLMVGTFALLGLPPFGSFFGELLVLSALVSSDHMFVFATFCVLITMTFVAMGRTIFPMIWGEPKERAVWPRQNFLSVAPKTIFLVALIVLGVYIPSVMNNLMQEIAASMERP